MKPKIAISIICFLVTAIISLIIYGVSVDRKKRIRDNYVYKKEIFEAVCTAYNALPNQTDSTPRVTATGTKVKENYTIAVSQDYIKDKVISYGDTIYIYEFGRYYSVEDCMNKRYNHRLDIFMENKKEARQFGLKVVHFSIIGGQ